MSEQKRLLILDDDAEALELMSRILGKKYQLLAKTDTDNLEQDLAEFQPHVIMIDHFIGEKTSIEIISRSFGSINHIPVILHSAHEEIEKISESANVSAYLRKPSSINEIRDCIERVLSKAVSNSI